MYRIRSVNYVPADTAAAGAREGGAGAEWP